MLLLMMAISQALHAPLKTPTRTESTIAPFECLSKNGINFKLVFICGYLTTGCAFGVQLF
jgi:hypothetical protein